MAVNAVVDSLREGGPPDELLTRLEKNARVLIEADVLHRLYPFADCLRLLDYSGHPWAAMVGGHVVSRADRETGRRLVGAARAEFSASGDVDGEGFAFFLDALEALGRGDVEEAASGLAIANELLPEARIGNLIATQLVFAEYTAGDLRGAIVRAEGALHTATMRRDPRVAAVAAMHLGWLNLWTGELDRCLNAVTAAERAFTQVEDAADSYELPLVRSIAGVVEALRQEPELGNRHFQAAFEFSNAHQIEWHAAIAHTLRAEVIAPMQPSNAIDEAQTALDYFDATGDTWWPSWASSALGIAHRTVGNLGAAIAAGNEAVERAAFPHEAARAKVFLGETYLLAGDMVSAGRILKPAYDLLDAIGADLWALRATVALAVLDPRRLEYRLRDARRRAAAHRSDPAWRAVLRGPARIKVTTLGEPSVQVAGKIVSFPSLQQRNTVCMLAAAGDGGLHVDTLRERLWPADAPDAVAHRLDNLLSQIRHALLPSVALERTGERLVLRMRTEDCDLRRLQRLDVLSRRTAEPAAKELIQSEMRAILDLPFMGGEIEEWIVEQQLELDAVRDRLDWPTSVA